MVNWVKVNGHMGHDIGRWAPVNVKLHFLLIKYDISMCIGLCGLSVPAGQLHSFQ